MSSFYVALLYESHNETGERTPPSFPPTVVMKMDIEGGEVEVLSYLLLSGAMAHIDVGPG